MQCGRDLLAEDGHFSLRAVAAAAGVSSAATYRHFADKQALESALAALGMRELQSFLQAELDQPSGATPWQLGARYAIWARDNRALFKLMFTTDCDPDNLDRCQAVAEIKSFMIATIERLVPHLSKPAAAAGIWGLVHGLTVLSLGRNLPAHTDEELALLFENSWKGVIAQ